MMKDNENFNERILDVIEAMQKSINDITQMQIETTNMQRMYIKPLRFILYLCGPLVVERVFHIFFYH